MRIRSNLKGTTGWLHVYNRAIRFRYMVTEEARRRVKILAFWKKHGLEAVEEAHGVKRRTIFSWQRKLSEGRGQTEALNPRKRIPLGSANVSGTRVSSRN